MKLLCYADLQADTGPEQCFTQPTTSLQVYRVRLFYSLLASIYEEHGCEGLVDLGDTFDDRNALPVPAMDAVLDGLQAFPITDYNFKLVGNHDQFLRDGSVTNSRLFDFMFRVIRTKSIMEDNGLVYIFASYPSDHDKLAEWLDTQIKKHRNKTKVLFGHFQVVGATLNGAQTCSGVPREIVDRCEVVLLGHIHVPQTVGKRIQYIGSPFQQNWGESGQAKRVAIFDTTTLQTTWVPLEGFPTYRLATLAEFRQEFKADSEDRWKVMLHNQEETEQFYALPYSNRFESVYSYDIDAPTDAAQAEAKQRDWSFSSALKRWTELMPPKNSGIEIAVEEVVEIGTSIATGS